MQLGSGCIEFGIAELQNCYRASGSNHPHQAAYQNGARGTRQAVPSAEYDTVLYARLYEALVNYCEQDVKRIKI